MMSPLDTVSRWWWPRPAAQRRGREATPHSRVPRCRIFQTLGLSPAARPPRGETPRMGPRPVAAPATCRRPNERMEQTGAHPALGGHQRPQRAGCSSAVVR